MECDTCSRSASSSLPLYCATCARNHTYNLRLEIAKAILDKEKYGRQVEKAVEDKGSQSSQEQKDGGMGNNDSSPRQAWERATANKEQSEHRTAAISRQSQILRDEIAIMQEETKQRKAVLVQRRSEAESVTRQIKERSATTIEDVEHTTKRKEQSWHSLHNKISESRAFLCREAAKLNGLKQRKKKGGQARDEYLIGGVGVVDLTDMNNAHPSQVTTSLTNVARLLVLVAHYLALRLPAEITLPHHEYPLATIFTPSQSYSNRKVPFPGTTAVQSSTASPTASRTGDVNPLPRPRPLFIEKKLPRLAREDPATYKFFVEGVSLLAWDVAWVCRTQGVPGGTESWEEICAIGRNLWQLLIAPLPSPTLLRVLSSRDVQRQKSGKEASHQALSRTKSLPKFGQFSHGTAHSFLGGAAGLELMRGWNFSKPTTVIDPLKKALLSEMNNAEWELLDEQEWDQGQPSREDDAVVVRNKAMDESALDKAESVMTAHPLSEEGDHAEDLSGKARGVSGWTKVRGR